MSHSDNAAVTSTSGTLTQTGVLDLTGGAPELHPGFRDLVRGARALGRRVIDRCNLTILEEPGQEDTAAFLRIAAWLQSRGIRRGVTDFCRFVTEHSGLFNSVAPLLTEAVRKAGATRILDIARGDVFRR